VERALVLLKLLKLRPRLCGFERAQRLLPAVLQFGRYQAIVGIHPAKLPFQETGVIAQPLDLVGSGLLTPLESRVVVAQDLVLEVQLSRSQYREAGRHDLCVDRIGGNRLAVGGAIAMACCRATPLSLRS
jgi:hypothetical protein